MNSITLVAAGTDTFGLHDTNSLVFASVEEIPLVTVATFLQKHPGAIMALASSGFETLDDLVGARIGFQEGGPWMLTQAMLVKNGIDPNSLEQQTIGFDLTPLFEGQIDLQTVFATTEPIIADSQGIETTVFVPYDYGVETSANALFTSKGYFEENPDVVCSMVRAMARGWEYVFENPDEAAGIVVAVDPDNLDLEVERKIDRCHGWSRAHARCPRERHRFDDARALADDRRCPSGVRRARGRSRPRQRLLGHLLLRVITEGRRP